jgi:hypothetical protein
MIKITCKLCSKDFFRKQAANKFCSRECYWNSKKGIKHYHGDKISKALSGVPKSPEHVAAVVAAMKKLGSARNLPLNEKHPFWKGDKAGYCAIHDWVRRRFHVQEKCSTCKKLNYKITQSNGLVINYLHLANISGEYKREISDWVYLCPKCHSALDKGRNSMTRVFNSNTGRKLK